MVTNNLKILPNLQKVDRRTIDAWWEEYLTSKNAGNIQPRNSYFSPQIEMQIGMLMFDEKQTDPMAWKKLSDEKWIKQVRERLPLNNQSKDHVMDCNHIIDRLTIDIDFDKEDTESKYLHELLKMEVEVINVYICDRNKVSNLIDRLIRKIERDAPYKGNEITRSELHTYLKDKQKEKTLTSIPRYCGIVRNWLATRREEYRTFVNRRFNSAPRLSEKGKDNQRESDRSQKAGKTFKEKHNDHPKTKTKPSANPNATQRKDKRCDGCGKLGHLRSECRMANIHPDFNKYGKWAESEVAKKVSELKFDTRANGEKFDFDAAKQAADGKGTTSSSSSKKEGPPERKKHKTSKCTDVCMCMYNTDYIDTDRMYLLGRYRNLHKSFNHTVLSTIYANNTVSNIHVLLDTGAL